MAIAFDNAASLSTNVSTSQTTAYTVGSGSDRILFVLVLNATAAEGANLITDITYGGVSMTKQYNELIVAGNRYIDLWYLYAPATGSNNVVITASSSILLASLAASYDGVSQSGFPDATIINRATGSSANTLTTIADNCWHVMGGGNESVTVTAGSSTTRRVLQADVNLAWFDGNAAKTPAGSDTINMTAASNASITLGSSIAPAAPASAIKTINGLAKASVKTVNNLAIASVKTWNGLA